MSLTITELDQKARDFLTLSGRMRKRGLDKGEMDVLSVLYLAHEGMTEPDVARSLGRLSADEVKVLALLDFVIKRGDQWLITRHGRALLSEVLA